ncbi:hypothetical protein C8Q74DRAFT_1313909 [Fomes fomentarius]|nr:hypothetical protein C8Q74DRAFT_1313909 [Fomes fomentarius]
MIIDKPPLLGDEVEIEDAPPSYDALENVPGPSVPRRDEKTGPSSPFPHIASASPTSPLSSVVASRKPTSKRTNAWFNFGPSSRATKEVRTTILGLLRDLIKQGDAAGALGVLESCADACKTYDLSLSSLMQEKSIEGHTPIYWAIINRPSLPPRPEDPDLLSAVLSHAAPLTDATVDELRLACLHTSDHALFQKLRRSPAFSPLTGREELITGGSTPIDDVDVEDVKEDEVLFVARFKIPMFQKRMRISGAVRLEFIAKGRLWELSFFVAQKDDVWSGYRSGSWVARLALLPHSPPTYIDSRLVIEDPRTRPPPRTRPGSSPLTPPLEAHAEGSSTSQGSKPKPPIELRLKAREQLTAPRSITEIPPESSMIAVPLEERNSLQFNGCPYLDADGSLIARLEARLAPPESDCIIC